MMVNTRRGLIVLFALALTWFGSACGAAAEPSKSAYFALDNGLQVFLQEKRNLPLTGMALAIDLGGKDESAETSGYAHLLEHMLLFGAGAAGDSQTRLAELRRHGVEHNAHTDSDLMTFEVSCPAKEGAWALEQMCRTVFSGRFDREQLEREKRVIAEEILQLRDNPDFLGRLLVMEQLFAGHPYGRPVFGDGGAVCAATVEKLQAFCAPRLTPDHCALSIVGDFTLKEMEQEVRRGWGALARGTSPAPTVPPCNRLQKSSERRIELDLQECHLFIGWLAPAFNDDRRLPFSLLTRLLGSGMNPIFNGVLRGERQLVDRVSMGYLPMSSGGMAILHLALEEKNVRRAMSEISSFLGRIGSFNFSPQDVPPSQRQGMFDYLESAKSQVEYDDANFREAALNLSTAAARFLLLNRKSGDSSYLESVARVNSGSLRRVAGEFLSGKRWAVLVIAPLAKKER